jgi:hypothetical protein
MPFYKSSLNINDARELQVGENPRDYSDFLIEISEQEYREIVSRRTKRALDADTWLCKKCFRMSSNFRVNCFWCGHPRQ